MEQRHFARSDGHWATGEFRNVDEPRGNSDDELPAAPVAATVLRDTRAAAAWRLKGFGSRVRLAQGSATDLRTAFSSFGGGEGGADGSYDAVFDFGIIHHIPNWRDAIGEVSRVLRPGGRFFFDEVTAKALARPTCRWLFDHPQEDRFTAGQFIAELNRIGLRIGAENWRTRIGGDYLLGVARKDGE